MTTDLRQRRLLIVEDEFLLAEDVACEMKARGAHVIGPAANVQAALSLIAEAGRIDGAILDLNLQGQMAFPVADALIDRGVPFVFATGYDRSAIPPRYAAVVRCEKPVTALRLAQALFGPTKQRGC